MTAQKSKSIQNLEERMQALNPESLRYQVLESARQFKTSWIDLGQRLFTVYQDKLFRDWGYLTFEAYCAKEIGIRQNTAIKLLKSYSFLEKEEPEFLKRESLDERPPSQMPAFESVNALRLAKKSGQMSEDDYEDLRQEVLEEAKEAPEVKKKIRYLLKSGSKQEMTAEDPQKAFVKRLVSYLENARKDAASISVPSKITKKIDELLELLDHA